MATVEVTIPSMLATLARSDRSFSVEANDVAGVLQEVFTLHPELRVHVLDESGSLRRHVMLFHNDNAVRGLAIPVGTHDRVTILQAVSGG